MRSLRGKGIARTMVRRLRLEAKRIGFKAEPTLILAVVALAYMLPPCLNSARFRMFLSRVGGQAFSADAAVAGLGLAAIVYVALPVLFILATKGRLREYGLGLGNVKTGLKICAVFYGLYIPCFLVLLLSESFRDYYASSTAIHAAQAGSLSRHLLSVLALMIGSASSSGAGSCSSGWRSTMDPIQRSSSICCRMYAFTWTSPPLR